MSNQQDLRLHIITLSQSNTWESARAEWDLASISTLSNLKLAPAGRRIIPTITDAMESLSTGIRHIVSLSGGKDSTALAIYMRQKYPQLRVEYIFCDTG